MSRPDHPDRDHPDRDHPDRDHPGPDHPSPDHPSPDHPSPDHPSPDHPSPDHPSPDHPSPDHPSPDHPSPDHPSPDHPSPDHPSPDHPSPDHPNQSQDGRDDPVWDLVDQARPSEAGPFFVRDVMREVRLSRTGPGTVRWWQGLFAPKPLLAGALGVAAAGAIVIGLHSARPDPGTGSPTASPAPLLPVLEELVEEEMLLEAAEDPASFPDETLVTLLY